MSRTLEGLRVLDLADRSAALAGRILADLGAEVVMIEPMQGSPIRRLAPFLDDLPGPERSFHHQYLSANKRSVVIDEPSPWTSGTFAEWVASADLLIDTARPGTRGGLEHERLVAHNPELVQVSVTPFGLSDTAGRKATDLVAGAAGGLLAVSGQRRGIPVQGGASPSYCLAGLTAASAALTALHQRDAARVQEPSVAAPSCHVDLSLQEATVMSVMQTANAVQWRWFDRIPKRPGLSSALRCKDGRYVGLLVRPDRHPAFLAWLDRAGIDHGMTEDDWPWARLDAPRKNNPVSEAILALTAALTRDEFVAGALETDLVCLPVLDFDDIIEHEQFRVNDQFLDVEHAPLGRALGFVRSPADGIGDGVSIERAPVLGEHTDTLTPNRPVRPSPAKTDVAPPDPARALEGIRVVDLSWVLAGPLGTRLLASFGADVIKIESSRKPDSMRSQLGPNGKPDPDLGGLYNTVNAGKKSFGVDLSTTRGLELLKNLIARADLVTNNFRPGALERMGLGYDVLRRIKPDIILVNLPGAHPKGPWAVRPSMGNILMSASGFNMLTGFPGEPPRGIGIPYPDFVSPHLMVACALAALRHRDRTGEGQEITSIQLSSTLSLLGVEWMRYRETGEVPDRIANRSPNHCPHGVYPARGEDEWLAVAVEDDAHWRALCDEMGRPEAALDAEFASLSSRKRNEDKVDDLVRIWTAGLDKWDAAARLQAIDIAAAPVEDVRDTMDLDPLLTHHYQVVHQPSAPEVEIPIDREAARWVGRDHVLRRAPGLAEHTFEIAHDLLGLPEDEIARLIAEGVLE